MANVIYNLILLIHLFLSVFSLYWGFVTGLLRSFDSFLFGLFPFVYFSSLSILLIIKTKRVLGMARLISIIAPIFYFPILWLYESSKTSEDSFFYFVIVYSVIWIPVLVLAVISYFVTSKKISSIEA